MRKSSDEVVFIVAGYPINDINPRCVKGHARTGWATVFVRIPPPSSNAFSIRAGTSRSTFGKPASCRIPRTCSWDFQTRSEWIAWPLRVVFCAFSIKQGSEITGSWSQAQGGPLASWYLFRTSAQAEKTTYRDLFLCLSFGLVLYNFSKLKSPILFYSLLNLQGQLTEMWIVKQFLASCMSLWSSRG